MPNHLSIKIFIDNESVLCFGLATFSPGSLSINSEEVYMPNQREASYRKLFFLLKNSDNYLEKEILSKIKKDYEMFHEHNILNFESLIHNVDECPYCKSNKTILYGHDKSGIKRYMCKSCNKTYNLLTNSLFSSSKINIKAWYTFLECLLSGTSMKSACLAAKISIPTGTAWLHKIFIALKDYQNSIILNNKIYIDETYIHVDKSKIKYLDEIGKIRKVPKMPRGLSKNKICILLATDTRKSFAEVCCFGLPQKEPNLIICKKHIKNNSLIIGDEDNSLTLSAHELDLKRIQYKSNTIEAYENLEPIDQLCNRLKFFIDKHRGFLQDYLPDYLNLFIFIDNMKSENIDLYKTTTKLLEILFNYKVKTS